MRRAVDMRQVLAFLEIHGDAIGQIATTGDLAAQNVVTAYEFYRARAGVAQTMLLLDTVRWFLAAYPHYTQFFIRGLR